MEQRERQGRRRGAGRAMASEKSYEDTMGFQHDDGGGRKSVSRAEEIS